MRLRTLVAGATVAVLATVGLPAAAHAAPVVPARALLTAAEFPAGSTQYTPGRRTPSTGLGGLESADCIALRDGLDGDFRRSAVADAVALRGRSAIMVSIVDRPLTSRIADVVTRCAEPDVPRAVAVTAPTDLERVRPRVLTTGADDIRGWADVRGTTVGVIVEGENGAAADRDAFWQLLRAQVAKVERQP
ncbi:hypothetical protein [Tsukamurella hominis]|uniref:hypothetical protein n=1 Tax=Tsukamurella hominis TaxID=1970232 RepID=UPI0039E73EF4